MKLAFCINTHNNLEYLKLCVQSIRDNAYFQDDSNPIYIYAENCSDGTNEWLFDNSHDLRLRATVETNVVPLGIGGGMNVLADMASEELLVFLHSDMYVGKYFDLELVNAWKESSAERKLISSHRVEPDIFDNISRPGTVKVPRNMFGEYWHNFDSEFFTLWAEEFRIQNMNYRVRKGEGAGGFLISREDWHHMGGNDSLFAPASWEDMDLFVRMQLENYEFTLTGASVIYHFGARGSHFPTDDFSGSSDRQRRAEHDNRQKWLTKWNKLPEFDENGFVKSDGMVLL